MDRILKEITISDFIDEFKKAYSKAEKFDIDALRHWLTEKNLGGAELFRFFWYIIDIRTTKSTPALGQINEYYREFNPRALRIGNDMSVITQHNSETMEKWSEFPIKKIIDILLQIKQKNTDEYSVTDISFSHKYEHLYHELCILQENKIEKDVITERLNRIRECIEKKEPYMLTPSKSMKIPEEIISRIGKR